jgi:hypothetical protein
MTPEALMERSFEPLVSVLIGLVPSAPSSSPFPKFARLVGKTSLARHSIFFSASRTATRSEADFQNDGMDWRLKVRYVKRVTSATR